MTLLELRQISSTIKRWIARDIAVSCRKPVPLNPGDGATQIFVLDISVKNDYISDELLTKIKTTIWCTLLKDIFVIKRYDFKIEVNKKEDEEDTIQIRIKMKCDKCYKRSNKPIPKGGIKYVSSWKK